MSKPNNILLLWNSMGDYHRARWKKLEEIWKDGTVYAADLGKNDSLYQWEKTESKHHYGLSELTLEKSDLRNRFAKFKNIVRSNQIRTVCIPGYGRIEYLLFLIWSKLNGINIILFAESWYGSNKWVNYIKSIFLKWACKSFLVSGERAERHFHNKLRIAINCIKRGYSVVDNAHFGKKSDQAKEKAILCVARFSPEKNHKTLFKAFLSSKLVKDWKLKCVGSGPLMDELLEIAKENESIQIDSWASYNELPEIYHKASLFILPSLFEPWGLVVNEAMAAGLPVIVSNACGCLPDLVTPDNGWSFDETNQQELINIFNSIAEMDLAELNKMGNKSSELIKLFTPYTWANSICDMANHESQ